MSSILDALEKLERSRPPSPGLPAGPPPPRRGWTIWLLGGVVGAGAAIWLVAPLIRPRAEAPGQQVSSGETTAPPDPVPAASAPAPTPTPAAQPVAAPPPAPPVETLAPDGPPPATEPGQAPPAPVLTAVPPVPAPAANAPRPWAQAVAPPTPPPVVRPPGASPREPVAMASARPADPEPPPVRRAPAGAPDVRLSFLLFSASADRRSVALSIDGGSLQTLHEGESTAGLDVVRILPDRVDLRWEGEAFTVRARD